MRSRPFRPSGEPGHDARLRATEDAILQVLAAASVEPRPKTRWPWEADVHHRLDLVVVDGVVQSARAIPRKGPMTKALPPPKWGQLVTTLDVLVDLVPGTAMPHDGHWELYMPLWPTEQLTRAEIRERLERACG